MQKEIRKRGIELTLLFREFDVRFDMEILSTTLPLAFKRNAWLTAIVSTWASVLEIGNSADSIASATHRDSLTASRYGYAMRHYIVRNNARERH